MKDYFEQVIEELKKDVNFEIQTCIMEKGNINSNIYLLGDEVKKEVIDIYEKYKKVKIVWKHLPSKGYGEIDFVSLDDIEKEHRELIDIMQELYQYIENDKEKIKEDIESWFPVFRFSNGDMFCIDSKNGNIVFYEHEVFDTGINLHGLKIANNINELFEKWSKCKFYDLYDWSKGVNEQGIDLKKSVFRPYLNNN